MYQYTPSVGGFGGMPSGASTTVMLVYFLIKSSQMLLKTQDKKGRPWVKLGGSREQWTKLLFCLVPSTFHLLLYWVSLLHTSQTKRLLFRSEAWCWIHNLAFHNLALAGETQSARACSCFIYFAFIQVRATRYRPGIWWFHHIHTLGSLYHVATHFWKVLGVCRCQHDQLLIAIQ